MSNSILTVSALNTYLSFKLKNDPKLKGVAVGGEISDLTVNRSSGHIYMTLTDGNSNVRAIVFSQYAARLGFVPEQGQSVIAFGSVEIYERSGVYQIICTQLILNGGGSEYQALAKLKDELQKAGVFSKPKKFPPKYPARIAVVTSASGAAIHDVSSTVSRRFPIAEVELFPAVVQGLEAPESLASALLKADDSGADVIILTRGGGSDTDLSCFNAKTAVMAVYVCKTPVVSAIGHEIDTTLCDLVADLRAATPTAAAELCTPDISVISEEISALRSEISRSADKKLRLCINEVSGMRSVIRARSPENRLSRYEYSVSSFKDAIITATNNKLSIAETRVVGYRNTLAAVNPMNVLGRGYALIYKESKLVTSSEMLSGRIEIVMKDGEAKADITDGTKES